MSVRSVWVTFQFILDKQSLHMQWHLYILTNDTAFFKYTFKMSSCIGYKNAVIMSILTRILSVKIAHKLQNKFPTWVVCSIF